MGSSWRPEAGLASGVVIRTAVREGAAPSRIADRYVVEGELGRGGMGVVYRVRDASTGGALALKQLLLQGSEDGRALRAALFEREYHTLAQLKHPRVIEVYDYGVDPAGPFYTMELLDQGDLRQRSPLPWATACALIYDVCSSLALLHSRRLVHRDVSPRNIRCTRDGSAKLIDFGAMAPMGPCPQPVGTPPFTAPEVLYRLAIDGRTDLFSVGATLYTALTGRTAYPARDLAALPRVWAEPPALPSALVKDIPPELDVLVMSLLGLKPELRPRTAFEVMQRLSAIAGLDREEPESVRHAYLATPTMVGRDGILSGLRKRVERMLRVGKGRGVVVAAAKGLGRSRLLDACALEAKPLGALVLRAGAQTTAPAMLGIAQTLAEQLLEALPQAAYDCAKSSGVEPTLFGGPQVSEEGIDLRPRLRRFDDPAMPYHTLQAGLARWVLEIARRHPLLIAVDDVHDVDESSIAFLAALAHGARERKLLLVTSLDAAAPAGDRPALDLLLSRCRRLRLSALDREHSDAMLGSVFGDVPYVGLLCERIFEVAAGNPRESMTLAQHLIDRGVVRYAEGGWTLPSTLEPADMPSSATDAYRERVAAVSELELRIAAAHALSSNAPITRQEHARLLPEVATPDLDLALTSLLSRQIVISDGSAYALAHHDVAACVNERLTDEVRAQVHRALATHWAGRERKGFAELHHLMAGGLFERALDRIKDVLAPIPDREALLAVTDLSGAEVVAIIDRALDAAQRLGRSPRDVHELRRWLVMMSVTADDAYYWKVAPAWRDRLIADSGLAVWRELGDGVPPGDRLSRAFTSAMERYTTTPEAERVYRPDEAIRYLVSYVVASIAAGARTYDVALLLELPELLAPFVPISPMIEAIWQNALATCDATCRCRYEQARARWTEVHSRLASVTSGELQYVDAIRNAIAFAVGTLEARLGIATATRWADMLDHDTLQSVNAMYLRKIAALQQGAADDAERYRRSAEVLAVQVRTPQMFTTLVVELAAHVLAGDLTGVQRVADRIEPFAQRHRGWMPYRHLARAQFERLRGDPNAALQELERCLLLCTPDAADPTRPMLAWPAAGGAYVETLVSLGRDQEARELGERALALCETLGLGVASHELARATCLAQARLGDYTGAVARIETVIAAQRALGVTGLYLGASYEARARIALWAGDLPAIEHYGALVAQEYQHGRGSALGARYERLMQEARRAGVAKLPELSELESTSMVTTGFGNRALLTDRVAAAMQGAETAHERAQRALDLLCDTRRAATGYLFLSDGLELRCVAARGDVPPSEGLSEFAADQLAREVRLSEVATGMLSHSVQTDSGGPSTWLNERNERHQALILSCSHEGAAVLIGVAVLQNGERRASAGTVSQLATLIAKHLVLAGDARGLPAA